MSLCPRCRRDVVKFPCPRCGYKRGMLDAQARARERELRAQERWRPGESAIEYVERLMRLWR